MAKVENIKSHIRKILNDAGLYRPELTYQIEMLASDIEIFRALMDEVRKVREEGKIVINEKSREDESRLKPHPIIAMVQAQANQLRQDLKVLLMNYDKTDNKGKGQKEDNTLAEFMKTIQEE